MQIGRRLRMRAAALALPAIALAAAGSWIPSIARAQSTPSECAPSFLILSKAEFNARSDLPALRAFLGLVPATCENVRALVNASIASIEARPEWRVLAPDGSIAAATPPPPPAWASNIEVWPFRIMNEMLVERPTEEQIQQLHPPRAAERERVGVVVMEGRALADGTFVWRIIDASPVGWGFEDAALRVGALYRAPATFADGRTTMGAPFVVVLGFTKTVKPIILY